MKYHPIISLIVVFLFLSPGCQIADSDFRNKQEFLFSFEQDLEGWVPAGTDLEMVDTTIAWSIDRSKEFVSSGSYSLKLYLENWNDAGKIWIEKPFAIDPFCSYEVIVEFDFGTATNSDINNFTIICGVSKKKPVSRDDLMYQDQTGNGSDVYVGYKWLRKSYSFNVDASPGEKIYATVGIWGTWETPRTYYVDNLKIMIRAKS